MRVIKQKKPWVPDLGDILHGQAYVKGPCTNEMLASYELVNLSTLNPGTWYALSMLGCSSHEREFRYKCPWSSNSYYHFMPYLILTHDNKPYREMCGSHEPAFDSDWIRKIWLDYDEDSRITVEPTSIIAALRGHGYTSGTLPYDGHGRWHLTCLELNNKDLIAGWLWVWYNK